MEAKEHILTHTDAFGIFHRWALTEEGTTVKHQQTLPGGNFISSPVAAFDTPAEAWNHIQTQKRLFDV